MSRAKAVKSRTKTRSSGRSAPKRATGTKRAKKVLGFNFRLHDLRVSHETWLLDQGTPVHVVAKRCGHDPAVLLRIYAKRTQKSDESAAEVPLDSLSFQLPTKP